MNNFDAIEKVVRGKTLKCRVCNTEGSVKFAVLRGGESGKPIERIMIICASCETTETAEYSDYLKEVELNAV